MTTIILDNGAHHMKIGSAQDDEPRQVPNSIVKSKHEKKRVFIGPEQSECTDKFSLFYVRPIERGYVVNWDTQQQIWERTFAALLLEPSTSDLIYTDNNYLIPALPDASNEILFDYFGFQRISKSSASSLVAMDSFHVQQENAICVIDTGFSWTTVACYVDGVLIQDSVIRIDVGGKALTNKLKDWISYRQLNVSEETWVINECKEQLCYVEKDFESGMQRAKKKFAENEITKRYIMPDFHATFHGEVKSMNEPHDPSQPSIHLGVERFAVPEILFSPSDIDIDQCGVAEAVTESILRTPETLRPALSESIVVVGGSSCFPGFLERLKKEVRAILPAEYGIKVSDRVKNPQTHAWQCAKNLVRDQKSKSQIPWITRAEWNEFGDSIEYSKFFKTLLSSEDLKEARTKDLKPPKEKDDEENF